MSTLKKRFATLFIAAAIICCGAVASQAQNGDNAPRYQMQPYGQQLTPDQMAKAQEIFNNSYAEMEATRAAWASKRAELDRELASANPNPGRIEALSREIGELRGKMLSTRADVRNRLAAQGLPSDCFGRGYGPDDNPYYGGYYGPCWGGRGDYPGNGFYRHHGHGWGGHRGGCWR